MQVKSCHWSLELPKFYDWKAIPNKYVLSFLQKVVIVLEDLIAIGSWFEIVGPATEMVVLSEETFL